jgi:hypothetical protein
VAGSAQFFLVGNQQVGLFWFHDLAGQVASFTRHACGVKAAAWGREDPGRAGGKERQ